MRWFTPRHGDKRYCAGFLLLPMRISDEWRWLERAAWIEWYDEDEWVPARWLTINKDGAYTP